MTDAGAIAGTISYLAPELLRGERADTRSDVWACGIVLHELLTGEQPFEGRTPFELTSTVLREPPRPLTLSVPAGLRTIRDNCLAKDPAHRYQNGGEWLAALEAYKSGKRVKTHVRPVRRERWTWAAAAAVVALLATAGGFIERHGAVSSVSRKASVAVLPLQGDGAGREPSYFADGVTEALIERLGTIDSIRVLSRTSTARYGPRALSATLRHDLNADMAVHGTVETPARTRSAGPGGRRHRHRSRDLATHVRTSRKRGAGARERRGSRNGGSRWGSSFHRRATACSASRAQSIRLSTRTI